jgi:hypothetical protein
MAQTLDHRLIQKDAQLLDVVDEAWAQEALSDDGALSCRIE